MLRIVGALLIFAACTTAGMYGAAMFRQRAEQLEAFHMLIIHIGAQIGSYLAPLDRIFDGWENRTLERCGFLAALRRDGGEAALEQCRARLLLAEDEAGELRGFFAGLGRHGAEEEARHCAYYEKRIGGLASTARGEAASRARLCRTFGLLAGLMLAVILL